MDYVRDALILTGIIWWVAALLAVIGLVLIWWTGSGRAPRVVDAFVAAHIASQPLPPPPAKGFSPPRR